MKEKKTMAWMDRLVFLPVLPPVFDVMPCVGAFFFLLLLFSFPRPHPRPDRAQLHSQGPLPHARRHRDRGRQEPAGRGVPLHPALYGVGG